MYSLALTGVATVVIETRIIKATELVIREAPIFLDPDDPLKYGFLL
jgi:hypothetical protein